MTRKQELEALTRLMGNAIMEEMSDASTGPPIGFCLLLFDFGEGHGETLSYASNARREDMIKTLREFADHLENQ